MKCVAIITARGGSKRIPRKNIRLFHNKPIIAYSIEAALSAGIFDEVMVSTDDVEIADLSKKYGALVPFLRSPKNADDFATTTDVLNEVIADYKNIGVAFTFACCIYPTAPFVTGDKLKLAFQKLAVSGADAVIPIAKFSFPIWRSFKLENDKIKYNWPENAAARSQDLNPAFFDCGQFYFFKTESFLRTGLLVTDNTIGMEIPETEVQDIDTEADWRLAEMKFKQMQQANI